MYSIAQPDNAGLVAAEDYCAVINLLNRLNMAFDVWDVEGMVQAFAPEATVVHPRGHVRGHEELRGFFAGYKPLTIGVRRVQVNHVVDVEADGDLTVTAYNLLIRVASVEDAEAVSQEVLHDDTSGLPEIEMWSAMTDRLRRYPEVGWRIIRRDVPNTVRRVGQ